MVGQLREEVSNKTNTAELKLFLEVENGAIEDGDIICFKKKLSPEVEQQARFPDVPSFLEYVKNRQISDILYYEVLNIPLPELQCLKTLKVNAHHSTKDEVCLR
ncbi:ubiquitin C-terminal hydrolase 13-like [Lycium barbarum]|uniref:ubiquitin C-terminal hydrolase 13-like n=1 Tax=Lycium barbarum TaxID=112863 RepID=UPI00293F59BE|nr:ubiquitin C-terminal hydrolase 13-like [Lycium barbarum]